MMSYRFGGLQLDELQVWSLVIDCARDLDTCECMSYKLTVLFLFELQVWRLVLF